jgi:excisionase family DNA binding protein
MNQHFVSAFEDMLNSVAMKAATEAVRQCQQHEQNLRTAGQNKHLLSKSEAAEFLEISVSTVERWTRLGRLPVVRMGGVVRYSPDSLREWIKRKETEASEISTSSAVEEKPVSDSSLRKVGRVTSRLSRQEHLE